MKEVAFCARIFCDGFGEDASYQRTVRWVPNLWALCLSHLPPAPPNQICALAAVVGGKGEGAAPGIVTCVVPISRGFHVCSLRRWGKGGCRPGRAVYCVCPPVGVCGTRYIRTTLLEATQRRTAPRCGRMGWARGARSFIHTRPRFAMASSRKGARPVNIVYGPRAVLYKSAPRIVDVLRWLRTIQPRSSALPQATLPPPLPP